MRFTHKESIEVADEIARLRADLERARKALEEISEVEAGSRAGYAKFARCQHIARAALAVLAH